MKQRFILVITLFTLVIMACNAPVLAGSASFTGKSKIAFVSNRNGNRDIYVINDNGTGLIQLTDSPQVDEKPIWSPDGSKILYISYEWNLFHPRYELWVVDADGTNRYCISDHIQISSTPNWSPDSARILYVEKNDFNTIMLSNADGSGQTAMAESGTDGQYPVWSPDGSKIACYLRDGSGTGIWVKNITDGAWAKLTEDDGEYQNIVWSSDGSQIAFTYREFSMTRLFGKEAGIYVMTADGASGRWLVEAENLYWCPDDSAVAFTHKSRHDSVSNTNYYGTYVIGTSGKGRAQGIVQTAQSASIPAWSPDGQKIAYISGGYLYVQQSGQAKPVRLNTPFAMGVPGWSSDSSRIVFSGYSALLFKKPSLYVIDLQDREVYQLTEDTFDQEPVWAPDVP